MLARPVYLIGHNTNTIAEVRDGLSRGLNAVEVDINQDRNGKLYVSHDMVDIGVPANELLTTPELIPFLRELKVAADQRLALVIFDSKVSDPSQALTLLEAVRTHLTDGGTSLPVVFSVSSVDKARTFFEPLRTALKSTEALMIDQEADPGLVAEFFRAFGLMRAGYGNGITTLLGVGLPSPFLVSQMDVATAFKAVSNLCFVYPWVLVNESTIREMLYVGVNGVMVDVANAQSAVNAVRGFGDALRLATRSDDPLKFDGSLLLQIKTADVSHAGTDARIRIELRTADNTYLKEIDGTYNGRFERGSTTCVVFPDLRIYPGDVRAITVSHDGGGNAPDWELESITLRGRNVPDKIVAFNCVVTKVSPVTRAVP